MCPDEGRREGDRESTTSTFMRQSPALLTTAVELDSSLEGNLLLDVLGLGRGGVVLLGLISDEREGSRASRKWRKLQELVIAFDEAHARQRGDRTYLVQVGDIGLVVLGVVQLPVFRRGQFARGQRVACRGVRGGG